MKTLDALVGKLTDEQLKEAFVEITEWKKAGDLKPGGIVRAVHQEFNEANNVNFMITGMDSPILYEIAKRFYENQTDAQAENERLKQEIIVLKEDRGELEREVIEMIAEDVIEKTSMK